LPYIFMLSQSKIKSQFLFYSFLK